ncbi:uncharacterized protein LOC109828695, partial [Asparagus officinalis]|uniref:uncharacterized protein LOC109828695 n=1 Tax=Asparagus officinalis TaxID=4686 RepID=UPI00098E194D
MSAEEKSLLGELNKDLENPDDFDIRILNSSGAFVHNFRISSTVSTRLDTAENNCLTKFCSQKVHRRYAVIRTDNSHINREELLYLLRGGRLDDKMEETLLETLQQEAYDKKFGIVYVYFLHVDFVEANVRRVFKYRAIKCEQQRGRYDCDVFVYLYIRAIIGGRSTFLVNPPGEIPEAMRARLAAHLLIAG